MYNNNTNSRTASGGKPGDTQDSFSKSKKEDSYRKGESPNNKDGVPSGKPKKAKQDSQIGTFNPGFGNMKIAGNQKNQVRIILIFFKK